jgi:serine/threonine protein kinase
MGSVDAEFRPGNVIAGRYELLTRLGEGGMGVVFKANDRVLGEKVGLKLLRSVAASDPQYAQRLRSEIKLARRISHKNVCRIYEYGEEGSHHYIAMELVHGATLRSIVAQRSALPADEAAAITVQVASGLEAIHEQHVVHRDLKPANVMLDGAGVAKVMDFGIAKRWDVASTQLTETGVVVGTPEYMSPEQAQGFTVDGRSDLYSLGLILNEMMTGRVAFRGTTPVATLLLHVQAAPPLDGPEAARIPAALLTVLSRALAKKPEERYSNAAEMRGALQEALDAIAGTAPASPASQTVRLESTDVSARRSVPTASQRRTPTEVPASTFTPGSTAAAPPGMGRLPPGVVVRPADPGARIEATVEPPRLGAGDAYVIRFHLVNLRGSALRLNAASLRRHGGPPTMLRLETKVAPPLARTRARPAATPFGRVRGFDRDSDQRRWPWHSHPAGCRGMR